MTKLKKTKLKKDYITGVAISLLVLIIIFEITVGGYIVNKLSTETIWEHEMALAGLIQDLDSLRYSVRSVISDKNNAGEGKIIKKSLDNIATYLKQYKDTIKRNDIRDLQKDVNEFNLIVSNLRKKSYVIKENINLSKHIEQIKNKALKYEDIKLYYEK